MKHLLTTSLVGIMLTLGSASGMAHSNDLVCDADLAYNIDVKNNELSFSTQGQQKVLILGKGSTSAQELYLDGNKQALNAEQQTLLKEYNQQIRQLLPQAAAVANEASTIAVDAVASVTSALLHDNPDKAKEFTAKVEKLSAGLSQHISQNHLRPEGIVEYIESSNFEAEFEALVESAVADFMENNVGEIVAAALSGNEDKVKAFEQRMEKFGQEMEQQFEARGEVLEKQAEKLCQLVQSIDLTEGELVKAFAKFDEYQLITE